MQEEHVCWSAKKSNGENREDFHLIVRLKGLYMTVDYLIYRLGAVAEHLALALKVSKQEMIG